ncbi:MAG: exopolysaccharide Pel transporter PelG [Candidatus Omnitrophica bacterium]|nr:exopolysaccharide Pel transporter PelG [Candidatus Omnitrophota bacterium]
MAGIGFRIEKILEGDTYIDSLKAHFYSTIIFSGPWLVSIVTLFLLNLFSAQNMHNYEVVFLRSTIIYIYAFSLIVVGILYLSASRYLADKLYLKEPESFAPVFNSLAILILFIQAVSGWAFVSMIDINFLIKFIIVLLYLTISLLWLIMIFLTSLRDYGAITKAFLFGSSIAVLTAWWLGSLFGIVGYFTGYFIGHFIIIILLILRIYLEFESKRFFDWRVFSFLMKNKVLVLTGIFYNMAIWIDKIVFWFSPKAVVITSFLRTFPEYESATFFAYLTIIPALSIFLIQVETNFYKKYRLFYAAVLEKGTYSAIKQAKGQMIATLKDNLAIIVVNQGVVTLLSIAFAQQLVVFFKLTFLSIPIFRLCILGAFLNCLLLIFIIIILYFDFKTLALLVTTIFLFSNGIFTYLTSFLELPFIGYGYLFSALISLGFAFYALDHKLKRLEYLTFAMQPVGIHREEEII